MQMSMPRDWGVQIVRRLALLAVALVLGLGWLGPRLWAQERPLEFAQLGVKDLFPQQRITALHKGRYGFLWCGTDLGLFRFDGVRVRWYRHDPDDPTTLTSGKVRAIQQDGQGRLWIGSNGGLNCMDPEQGTFKRFTHDPANRASLDSDNVWSLCVDDGRVWVGTDMGLNLIEEERVTRFEVPAFQNGVTTIALGPDRRLWVGTDVSGAGYFDLATRRFIPISILEGQKVRVILPTASGRIWVGTLNAGLFAVDPDQTWQNYRHDPAAPRSLASDNVYALALDRRGTLWIGTEHGLCEWRPASNAFRTHQHEDSRPSSLNASIVNTLCADADDLLWVGTTVGGLNRLDLRRSLFTTYDYQRQGGVLTLASQGPARLWVGCRRGLALLDLSTGQSRWFLESAVVRTLLVHSDGSLLVGTESGLVRLRLQGDRAEQQTLLAGRSCWRLLADGDEALWVATNKELIHYRLDTGAETLLEPQSGSDRHINHRTITALAHHPDGSLLVGTYGGGLNRLLPGSGAVRHYLKDPADPNSISANDITHLLVDHHGRVWIATFSGGLCRLDPDGKFVRVLQEWSFPNHVFVALCEDKAGMIWILDSEGLVRYNPVTGSHLFFESTTFASPGAAVPGACASAPREGTIFFGGTDGLVRFQPDNFDRLRPSQLVITNVRRGNIDVAHILPPGQTLKLSYEDKTFSLDACLIDFRAPGRAKIGTWRDNLDDGWVWSEGNHATVSYTRYLSMSGGKGLLKVRAIDPFAQEVTTALPLEISAPFWITWLPLLIVLGLALLVALIYLGLSFFERRKRRALIAQAHMAEQRRELAEQRAQVAERQQEIEAHERKLKEVHMTILQRHLEQVSTEIANDLHDGPLASLNGLGFQLRALARTEDRARQSRELHTISDSMLPGVCGALRNVCGQLLLPDFRYGLVAELESFADVFCGLYPELTLHRAFTDEVLPLDDEVATSLYRIFRTLLKNVGQHSGARQAWVRLEREAEGVCLTIEDDGHGFTVPDDWESFRERKHYGMYMANYFAVSVGGQLTVHSSSAGTVSRVTTPMRHLARSSPDPAADSAASAIAQI